MGVLDFFKGRSSGGLVPPKSLAANSFEVKGSPVKIIEVGSTGTEIFGGYIQEEYLHDLQGKDAADIYDRMRRSDPKIRMVTSAMKNPIQAATYEMSIIEGTPDELMDLAQKQKELISHILFHDLGDKSWSSFIREALSVIEFGYSLFEKTYKPVMGHPKFGSYNGIASLGFRSQRTIEKWNLDKVGKLASVSQYAYGDSQKVVDIPASFLLHFAIEMEGSNYEGIGILRPCYGPWLRKNQYLKMIASGIEKYAVGIPTLEIPAGEEGEKNPQYKLALKALQRYVTGQAAYITKPKGWELNIVTNTFDAEKIRTVIDSENVEIVNAALANFLELGQSGSGSYSLSFDLSDFFLGGLEYIAKMICEGVNKNLVRDLVRMNFGTEPLVELQCSGISDKAGEELSKVLLNLQQAGMLTPDERLEESLRKRFGLPPKEGKVLPVPTKPGAPTPATPTPSAAPVVAATDKQETALNGAQVSSMIEVVTKFKEGVLDRSSAVEMLMYAFNGMPKDRAEAIVGEALTKPVNDLSSPTRPDVVNPKLLALAEEDLDEGGEPTKDPVIVVMDESADLLRNEIRSGLKAMSAPMIKELIDQWEKEGDAKFNAKVSAPDPKDYQAKLKLALMRTYNKAQDQVSEEIPKANIISLAEDPRKTALVRINSDVMSLTDAQVNDLIKNLQLTYGQNLEAAATADELLKTLEEAVDKFIQGPVSTTGPDIQAAKTVNDSRRDFFNDNTESVISYTWVNGDPVSDICKFLDGKTIAAGHPDVNRYWPPLHHNCKTYVIANTSETTDNPDPLSSFDVPEDIAATMTLSELRGKKLTRVRTRRRIRS